MFGLAKGLNKVNRGTTVSVDELVDLQSQAAALRFTAPAGRRPVQAGNLPWALKGHGMEHLETRALQQGDEIRHIDWRVTARTGRAHVKLFEEERDHRVYLMVDQGLSMRFGTREAFKSVQAARAATLMAWAAADSGCRVGGIVINGEQFCHSPARAGHCAVLNLIKTLSDSHAQSPDAGVGVSDGDAQDWFDSALARLCQTAPEGASIIIFSDFYSIGDAGIERLAYLGKYYDLTVIFIYDALESEIPAGKSFYVTDGRQRLLIDASDPGTARAYRQQFERHRQRIEARCLELEIGFITLATDQDAIAALSQGFDRRQGGRR